MPVKRDHILGSSLIQEACKRGLSNAGFGASLLCAESLQTANPLPNESSPQKQTRKKHKGRHSSELKFRIVQGVLEKIDEEDFRESTKKKKDVSKRLSFLDAPTSLATIKKESLRVRRSRLEEDVVRLEKRLKSELDLRTTFETAIADGSGHLSAGTHELVTEISLLEDTVSMLEQQLVALHFQIGQERTQHKSFQRYFSYLPDLDQLSPLSSKSNTEKSFSSLSVASADGPPLSPGTPDIVQHLRSTSIDEQETCSAAQENIKSPPEEEYLNSRKHRKRKSQKEIHARREEVCEAQACCKQEDAQTQIQEAASTSLSNLSLVFKGLCLQPNKLSQKMVQCMMDIYHQLSHNSSSIKNLSSPTSPLTNASTSSSESSCSWELKQHVVVNNYSSVTEVKWTCVAKEKLNYAAQALRNYKIMVEQLGKVDPSSMTHPEKVAFWINIYNALMMHAYLAYGVPESELEVFSIMRKACYVIGGHTFTAIEIEYHLLKLKPPPYRPQIVLLLALHKIAISDEKLRYGLDHPEPLVTFALSSGARSSPAVRVYGVESVEEELKASVVDYVRASVGVMIKERKLLIPNIVYDYYQQYQQKEEHEEGMLEWIFDQFTKEQIQLVKACNSFTLIPFDFSFTFLLDYSNNVIFTL